MGQEKDDHVDHYPVVLQNVFLVVEGGPLLFLHEVVDGEPYNDTGNEELNVTNEQLGRSTLNAIYVNLPIFVDVIRPEDGTDA